MDVEIIGEVETKSDVEALVEGLSEVDSELLKLFDVLSDVGDSVALACPIS